MTKTFQRFGAVLLVALLAIVPSGCGSDDDANPTAIAPETGSASIAYYPADLDVSWCLRGSTEFECEGIGASSFSGIPVGRYTVDFAPVDGWYAPDPVQIDVVAGQTTRVTVVFQAGPADPDPRGPEVHEPLQ